MEQQDFAAYPPIWEGITIRVPASTANLGSGFDSIGVAFQLYLTVHVRLSDVTRFDWMGDALSNVNISDEDNLILKGLDRVYESLGRKRPAVHVVVDSQIPLTRGLGSSASAFVAGIVAANEMLGNPLTKDELLWLATEEEGHPDNVGASLFGGIFIGTVDWEKKKIYYHTHPFPENWQWIAAIPDYPLSTSKARGLLPQAYDKSDAVFNLSRFGILVASLLTGNREGVAAGLDDRFHQPYRQHLIPGFAQLLDLKEELDAIGFVISGAGPTVLGLVEKGTDYNRVLTAMQELLSEGSQCVKVLPLEVDHNGACHHPKFVER